MGNLWNSKSLLTSSSTTADPPSRTKPPRRSNVQRRTSRHGGSRQPGHTRLWPSSRVYSLYQTIDQPPSNNFCPTDRSLDQARTDTRTRLAPRNPLCRRRCLYPRIRCCPGCPRRPIRRARAWSVQSATRTPTPQR